LFQLSIAGRRGLNTAILRSGDLGSPRTRIDLMRLADNSASFSRGQIYGAAGLKRPTLI